MREFLLTSTNIENICTYCDFLKEGDLYHLLIACPFYTDTRSEISGPSLDLDALNEFFVKSFVNTDTSLLQTFVKLLRAILQKRRDFN